MRKEIALRVARIVCIWSLGTGVFLAIIMWAGVEGIQFLLVPPAAQGVFLASWWAATISQPLNALTFATDGIHWGTGDFRYLRNATSVATILGVAALWILDLTSASTLFGIWIVTAGWILVRTAFGVLRIWPGSKHAPLGQRR